MALRTLKKELKKCGHSTFDVQRSNIRTSNVRTSARRTSAIDTHNQDSDAHPELASFLDLDERLSALEDSLLEGETQSVTPSNSITIYAQNVYIGYNGSVDIQPYPPDEFFDDVPEDELALYGIKKTRRRKAYKLLKPTIPLIRKR